MFNTEIEQLLSNLIVNGETIPVSFAFDNGNKTKYVTYVENYKDSALCADDELQAYVCYYDFDIYVKRGQGSYYPIIEAINNILVANGWLRQVTRDSADMYESDTGYFHKTICFAKEREVNNG